MKVQWTLIVAASLAVGPFALAQEDTIRREGSTERPAAVADRATVAVKLPAGITAKEADDVEDIRDLIGTATNAALTKDGVDDLVERLVDQDRNRIGDIDDKQLTAINDKVAVIQKAFKDKYGKDFKVDHRAALGGVAVIQGEVSDAALALANWPGARAAQMGDRAVQAGAGEDARRAEVKEDATEKANLEKGREVAIATLPAMGTSPALNVWLVGEATAWRIDVPNSLTREQLQANLQRHLTQVSESIATWPADANQASALISRHVMQALYDSGSGADARPAAERTAPAASPAGEGGMR